MRNDWNGDVGFRFVAKTALVVTALGRQAPVTEFGPGVALAERVAVTLWSAESGAPLRVASVGPESEVEGGYAYSLLKEEVLLDSGKEYRLSQQCTAGMLDMWFDGVIPPLELSEWSAGRLAEFRGGVYRDGFGYPGSHDDDERFPTKYRRAGMLNFKMLGEDPVVAANRFMATDSRYRPPAVAAAVVDAAANATVVRPEPPAVAISASDNKELLEPQKDLVQIRLVCMSLAPSVRL